MKWYDSPLALPLSFRKLICVGVLVHLNLIRPGVATKRASRPPRGMVFYLPPVFTIFFRRLENELTHLKTCLRDTETALFVFSLTLC